MGELVPAQFIVALLNPKAIKTKKNMATNETRSRLIDRRNLYNNGELIAAAFIEFFHHGKVRVYGKFYNGFKGNIGPVTEMIAEVPNNLLEEVRRTTWQQNNKSPELQAWCNEVWAKAKKIDDWFEKF